MAATSRKIDPVVQRIGAADVIEALGKGFVLPHPRLFPKAISLPHPKCCPWPLRCRKQAAREARFPTRCSKRAACRPQKSTKVQAS